MRIKIFLFRRSDLPAVLVWLRRRYYLCSPFSRTPITPAERSFLPMLFCVFRQSWASSNVILFPHCPILSCFFSAFNADLFMTSPVSIFFRFFLILLLVPPFLAFCSRVHAEFPSPPPWSFFFPPFSPPSSSIRLPTGSRWCSLTFPSINWNPCLRQRVLSLFPTLAAYRPPSGTLGYDPPML